VKSKDETKIGAGTCKEDRGQARQSVDWIVVKVRLFGSAFSFESLPLF
jgi:hypothetical protein